MVPLKQLALRGIFALSNWHPWNLSCLLENSITKAGVQFVLMNRCPTLGLAQAHITLIHVIESVGLDRMFHSQRHICSDNTSQDRHLLTKTLETVIKSN
jgi:hypothetical protein